MHLFMIVLMGIDCCHYYSHFFVLYYDVERCNDCNNAAVLYPIAMIVAIFVDFDDMVKKTMPSCGMHDVLDGEDACVQS